MLRDAEVDGRRSWRRILLIRIRELCVAGEFQAYLSCVNEGTQISKTGFLE
jgi:hypothetical protein